jgi:SAM-dependent MidA family methyltransferase
MLKVKMTKKMGRGVFATQRIKKNQIISVDEIILIDLKDRSNDDESLISKYVYHFNSNKTALALGIGSLYNHSERKCNADWKFELINKRWMIVHYTVRTLQKGEQIFIDYGYSPK